MMIMMMVVVHNFVHNCGAGNGDNGHDEDELVLVGIWIGVQRSKQRIDLSHLASAST